MEISLKTKIINVFRKIIKILFSEKFLRRLSKGKSESSLIYKLIPRNYQYDTTTAHREVTLNNIQFKLDISDLIGWHLYFGFEDQSTEQIFELCKKGDYVVDIGANIGYVTLNIAQKIGAEGRLFSFEPDPINFKRLEQNLALNNLPNITLENKGLGEQAGQFNLVVFEESNRGMNRIIEGSKEGVIIKIISLDQYLEHHSIPKLNLIKIDVEGYEMKVLTGAQNTLEKFKPVLFIELDDDNLKAQGSSAQELIHFLITMDYEVKRADDQQLLTPNNQFSHCHFDIICQ